MSIVDVVQRRATWGATPFGRLFDRSREAGRPDLQPLSVFLDEGVVPRASRDDNHNQLGSDLGAYLVVRPGDMVFNKLRTWQGGLGVSAYEGVVSPAYFVCRPKHEVEPRFTHYLLRSTPYLQELTRISKWMPPAQFDIGWEDLRALPLIDPPLPEQRAIADYLDAQTAHIDAVVSARRRQSDLLSSREAVLVWNAVTKGLSGSSTSSTSVGWIGAMPAHWGLPALSAHYEVQLGKMLNPEATYRGEQFAYLRNVNVQWDRIDLEGLNRMHFDAEDRRRYQLEQGDLLVCEGGEVGRAALWGGGAEDCYYQKALHRVRPRAKANARFLMYVLWAASTQGAFESEGNTSTIVHLTAEKLRAHRIPWPPTIEQEAIVSHLDAARTRLAALRQATTCQIDLLLERRQALITAAVTGQLEIPGVAA